MIFNWLLNIESAFFVLPMSERVVVLINNLEVYFEKNAENQLLISFGSFHGTLTEVQDFRRSFDYECYKFGSSRFTSACWQTIRADDNEYQKYPLEVTLENDLGHKIIINWCDINKLILESERYLKAKSS